MARRPDFIIIGAMKCATSTLHEQLAAQPGIVMSTPKEPNFFSDDDQYARGLCWYEGLFEAAGPSDLCGESSTHYTKLPTYSHTVPRLKAHVPRARFIYLMRHPIDRLISHYIHGWTQREIQVPLDKAIAEHPELVDYGRYAMQLEPYIETFGFDRVLPVFFDHLHAAPDVELKRVCEFLGYAGEPCWSAEHAGENVSAQRLRRSPLRETLRRIPGLRPLYRSVLSESARDRINSLWRVRRRPALSAGQHARLAAEFDKDLARLGQWLGIELSCKNFKSITSAQSYSWHGAKAVCAHD